MAEEECILCCEHIAIPVFERNPDNVIKVEGDASRLQCGHAYHTQCILQSLQHRTVCPLCNVRGQQEMDRNDWWNQGRIEMEGRCIGIMEKVKKDAEVRLSVREYKEQVKTILKDKRVFDKRINEFRVELRKEMGIDQKMKDVRKSHSATIRLFSRKAKSEGSLFAGAHSFLPTYKVDKFLFGETRFFRYRMSRIF
jgi:hypothetical protein